MLSLALTSRGLRAAFRASKVERTFNCCTGRGWSSSRYEVVRDQPGVFDTILVARSPIGTVGTLVCDARKTLAQATKSEKLYVKKVKEVFVGNSRGLDLTNLTYRLDTELAAMKDKITKLELAASSQEATKDKITQLELAAISQEERIKYLLYSDDCYRSLRGCYLSTLGRIYFGIHTKEDQRIVEKGNLTAHWGDAVFDSSLYTGPNSRTDTEVFQMLYGVLPKHMEKIRHDEIIKILNYHAGVLSSDKKTASQKFHDAFTKFITLFEKSGFNECFLDGKDTEVTRAYRTFVHCFATEVKRIRPKRRS